MKKLLFVDTNKWLDFYRSRTAEAGVGLAHRLDGIRDQLIITSQVEMEFKKHRQSTIIEALKTLKHPEAVLQPGLFADAKESLSLRRDIKKVEQRVNRLKARLLRALEKPAAYDEVYQVFQRCYHKNDDLCLVRETEGKDLLRRKAFRRFLLGCPPRKRDDTSIGDAINWEWIVRCAIKHNAEIHIVSRDSDYGVTVEEKSYINDHLLQEFRERVSKKRGIFLYTRLSDALKKFAVEVTRAEEKEESAIIEREVTHNREDSNASSRLSSLLAPFLPDPVRQMSPEEEKKLEIWLNTILGRTDDTGGSGKQNS